MYRRPPLPDLKPPLAFGGHTFVHAQFPPAGRNWLRCVYCYRTLTDYELREGFMGALIGAWCPDVLLALERPAVKHTCEYCKGVVTAAPRHMERILGNHLDACPAALRNGHKPREVVPKVPRKRVIPRQSYSDMD